MSIRRARHRVPIWHDGVLYPSFHALCQQHDVLYATVKSRLLRGFPLAVALTKTPSGRLREPVFQDGTTYINKSAAPKVSVRKPISGQDYTRPVPQKRASIIVDGVTYPSRASAARAHGVQNATFLARLAKNWTPEQAAGLHAPPHGYTVEGRHYNSLHAVARAYNINQQTLHTRLKKSGWTIRQAVGLDAPPSRAKNRKSRFAVELDGTHYTSRAAVADAFGLSQQTLANRIDRHGDIETALYGRDRDWKDFTVHQTTYRHLGELAKTHSIPTVKLYRLLDEGVTLRQLIDTFERFTEGDPS